MDELQQYTHRISIGTIGKIRVWSQTRLLSLRCLVEGLDVLALLKSPTLLLSFLSVSDRVRTSRRRCCCCRLWRRLCEWNKSTTHCQPDPRLTDFVYHIMAHIIWYSDNTKHSVVFRHSNWANICNLLHTLIFIWRNLAACNVNQWDFL